MSEQSVVTMTLREIRYANIVFWRVPAGPFFALGLPLVFLVMFNLISSDHSAAAIGATTAGITTFVVVSSCYLNLAIASVVDRELGILRRIRSTPLPALYYVLSRVLHAAAVGLGAVALMVATSTAFGLRMSGAHLLGALVMVTLGVVTFCALGAAISVVVPGQETVIPITMISVFPLLFLSDVFFPLSGAPAWLHTLMSAFPVRPLGRSVNEIFTPGTAGTGIHLANVAVLAGWAVFGLLAAAKWFRTEPRR